MTPSLRYPFASDERPQPDLGAALDPLCGIITALRSPDIPGGAPEDFLCVVAEVADTRRYGGWYADRIAAGTAFGDPGRARNAAIGEAFERYCGNFLPPLTDPISHAALVSRGKAALGPDDLPRWSDEQLGRPGFAYREFTGDTEVEWVAGVDANGAESWAPASWVYLNYHHGARRQLPWINHLNYSGIATGSSPADAARRALAELVERDAMVTWWYSGAGAAGLDQETIPGFRQRWQGGPLSVNLIVVPTDLPLIVVGAYVFDERTGVPASGFAAAPDAASAAEKASQEALQVWIASSGLLRPDGSSWRAIAEGILARRVYFPYRETRSYLDDAGDGFRHVKDLASQTQLWLDPRMLAHAHRFTSPTSMVSADELGTGSIDEVVAALTGRGHPPVAFDLTTPDVAEIGAATVRVLAPGLQPNAPAGYQYLGTARLHQRKQDLAPGVTPVLAPPPHN